MCKVNNVIKLENTITDIKLENAIIKKNLINPEVPKWAEEAFSEYKKAGFNFDSRGHSMDFYRIITLLHLKKLL